MKRPRVGNIYYAADYKEQVMVIAIERRDVAHARCTIQRRSGQRTENYPSYLLSRVK
jgi:hypothetical protein